LTKRVARTAKRQDKKKDGGGEGGGGGGGGRRRRRTRRRRTTAILEKTGGFFLRAFPLHDTLDHFAVEVTSVTYLPQIIIQFAIIVVPSCPWLPLGPLRPLPQDPDGGLTSGWLVRHN